MDLAELQSELETADVVEEAETEQFDDDDTEVNLSNALSLLEDCHNMLLVLMDPKVSLRLNIYMRKEIEGLGEEVGAFLNEFDLSPIDNEVETEKE